MVSLRVLYLGCIYSIGIGAAAFHPQSPIGHRRHSAPPSVGIATAAAFMSEPQSVVGHRRHSAPSPLSLAAAAQGAESPRALVQKGMQAFKAGDVSSSLAFFDQADAALPDGSLRPYLWQRGITLYYLDQFKEGSDQFRLDVSVNPLDVEEIVWDIACQAREGKYPTKDRMLALPTGRKDRRKIMSTVYALFRDDDGATEFDLREAGHDGNVADEFYSLFYLGLYCEARTEMTKAERYIKAAASSKYAVGPGINDYMTSCAKVHCKLRGWV